MSKSRLVELENDLCIASSFVLHDPLHDPLHHHRIESETRSVQTPLIVGKLMPGMQASRRYAQSMPMWLRPGRSPSLEGLQSGFDITFQTQQEPMSSPLCVLQNHGK